MNELFRKKMIALLDGTLGIFSKRYFSFDTADDLYYSVYYLKEGEKTYKLKKFNKSEEEFLLKLIQNECEFTFENYNSIYTLISNIQIILNSQYNISVDIKLKKQDILKQIRQALLISKNLNSIGLYLSDILIYLKINKPSSQSYSSLSEVLNDAYLLVMKDLLEKLISKYLDKDIAHNVACCFNIKYNNDTKLYKLKYYNEVECINYTFKLNKIAAIIGLIDFNTYEDITEETNIYTIFGKKYNPAINNPNIFFLDSIKQFIQ